MAKKKAVADTPPAATDAAAAEYTVLARRYRPQQFADLVGQEPVAQALVNAIKSGRVAHAYLFTGARGVGKTSAARILAKALDCAKGPTPTPCGECEMCRSVASGEDVDVIEIDAATHNKVDQIRNLRENVHFRPIRARYKIYIIDEVHMLALSRGSFDALLKTLEEPPEHVKFVFCTTEASKIPATILSRCQRFDFAGIGTAKIIERLRSIVSSEKMAADDEALEMIARRAAGSMRDAQSLLDQLLTAGDTRLTVDRVHDLLGAAHEERVAEIAVAVIARDAKQALALLARIVDQGQQLGELLDQLIEYWRDLMVVQAAGVEGQMLSVTGKFRDGLVQQAKSLSPDTILAGLDVLVTAKNRLRGTSHGRVILEITLVRLCQIDNLVPLSQLALWLGQEGSGVRGPAAPSAVSQPARGPANVPAMAVEKKKVEDESPAAAPVLPLRPENLEAIRQQLLIQSGLTVGGELRRVSRIAISGPNALVFQVPARYNLRSEQVLEGQRRTELTELLSRIVGHPCQIRVEIVAEPSNGQVESSVATSQEAPHEKARRQRAEIMLLPLVNKAMHALGAQIVGVDDEFGKLATAKKVSEEASDVDETMM